MDNGLEKRIKSEFDNIEVDLSQILHPKRHSPADLEFSTAKRVSFASKKPSIRRSTKLIAAIIAILLTATVTVDFTGYGTPVNLQPPPPNKVAQGSATSPQP